MIRELVVAATSLQMAIAGIVGAVMLFVVLIGVTFRSSAKRRYSQLAQLPLLED